MEQIVPGKVAHNLCRMCKKINCQVESLLAVDAVDNCGG